MPPQATPVVGLRGLKGGHEGLEACNLACQVVPALYGHPQKRSAHTPPEHLAVGEPCSVVAVETVAAAAVAQPATVRATASINRGVPWKGVPWKLSEPLSDCRTVGLSDAGV